ncbi:hypothetical protein GOV13_02515 [Candidatus Pacearchaeota archaeon]|nr:hypothetical protein [Candidatus Pacearchaeota archaeon]
MPKEEEILDDEEAPSEDIVEAHEEESDLIEILDDERAVEEVPEEIDENRFTEFLQPIHGSSPILEHVAGGGPAGPVFFATGGGGSPQAREGVEGDDPFKYANQGGGNGEDPKYVDMGDAGGQLERVDFETVGKDPSLTRDAGFVQSTETKGMESKMYETKMDVERADPLKVGTHETIQEEKKKQYWIK